MKEYTVVVEKDEEYGGYVGEVPGVPGCHTQGKTIDELMERMEEVIELCREAGVVEEPAPVELRKLRVPV
jgi:predicted RNase H-like HicB family nuclease